MAVYKRGYSRYEGDLTSRWQRLLVLPRFTWPRLLGQRLVIAVFILAAFWPLLCTIFIYLSNHPELWSSLGDGPKKFLTVDGNFFLYFLNVQVTIAIALAALTGPGLIAPDLANNALPLYFSRPMTRWEYVAGRLIVLVGLLSVITWIPGLTLYATQVGMAGWSWFQNHWWLGAALFIGFSLWILFIGLVALACSAWVKWRIVAGGSVLGTFFLSAGAAQMINAVFRSELGLLLHPGGVLNRISGAMLGVELSDGGPDVWACVLALAIMFALLVLVLERKIRPVEVIK